VTMRSQGWVEARTDRREAARRADATPTQSSRADAAPVLTPTQLARLAALGRERRAAEGEVLVEVGVPCLACFVVTAGRLDVVHPSAAGEVLVLALGPGTFTGEQTMLTGRPAIARIRAAEASTVIEIDRAPFLVETSLPGVLAVGDVRSGSIKRVASAVGEGSIAISFAHRILAE
jgi:CRP-like cAMP-binding protein